MVHQTLNGPSVVVFFYFLFRNKVITLSKAPQKYVCLRLPDPPKLWGQKKKLGSAKFLWVKKYLCRDGVSRASQLGRVIPPTENAAPGPLSLSEVYRHFPIVQVLMNCLSTFNHTSGTTHHKLRGRALIIYKGRCAPKRRSAEGLIIVSQVCR